MATRCTLRTDVARARMGALGQTQASLASACDIDVRTVQRWFAGQGVNLADAERVAVHLGVGTGDLFEGVPAEAGPTGARLRLLQRLLGARDIAFAQGFRLLGEHFDIVLESVSFAAHPVHGFVSRHSIAESFRHGFVVFRLACGEQAANLEVRCQVGRQFSYVVGKVRLRGDQAAMVETFQNHSMLARRAPDGSLALWFWVGAEHREVVFVGNREFTTTLEPRAHSQLCALDGPEAPHILCFRPNVVDLRAAGLPRGFDRLTGPREGRVDVPLSWDDDPS
ncbi:MAG: helix-turn-helix transcriptional regulator [Myxococcales bacterium]